MSSEIKVLESTFTAKDPRRFPEGSYFLIVPPSCATKKFLWRSNTTDCGEAAVVAVWVEMKWNGEGIANFKTSAPVKSAARRRYVESKAQPAVVSLPVGAETVALGELPAGAKT